ncbi:UNVERIFIED_CONTAM: hypothetical protein Sindi_0712200, partial [Sesamum indicum]
RTDVGAVGIRRSGVLVAACGLATLKLVACGGRSVAIPILGALASSPLPANMEASRAAGDGLHPRPSAPGGTHTGGCLRGVWALGAGRGKAAPPQPQASAVLMAWAWLVLALVLAARVRRGTPVGRLSGGLRCCVRPMPICIVCAECLPVRNGKPSGACFDCDLLKHGQHKPRPSKGWSVGPLMLVGLPRISGPMRVPSGFDGRGCLSPLPVACEHGGVKGGRRRLAPPTVGSRWHPHRGGVWSSSSSVARDPEISSTWLAKCRQSRHARLPHGSWGMLLGALASSPSPAKVEASHRQVGPVPRFLLLGSQLVLRPESSCLPGHAWACLLPFACRDARMRRGTAGRQHPPQAASVVGPSALLPWPRSVSCAAYPSRRHSIVPNVPFSPCAAPLGAAARGGPQGARCVPRPAHGRTCPGRWPIASSPDLSDAEHTVGTRPRPLFAPKASVRRFVRTTPATVLGSSHAGGGVGEECYLVDPASSHMLVSKIKPCMCNYSLFDGTCYSDNRSNSRANTCNKPRLLEGMHLLDKRSTRAPPVAAMIHDNSTDRTALVPATHHSNFCPINFRWVRFRRGSLRNGYHIQGRQQARKLPNPDTGRIHWRASLVPAAAVIPAPIAWTLGWAGRSASGVHRSSRPFCRRCAPGLNWPGRASGAVTLKKLECSKQAYALYTLAWDNIIGFRSYYVGLRDRTFAKDVFINQERKLGARRRSDTVLVSTINDADQGSADVAFRTPPAPYEKSKSLGSGGSMVARLKLKGIDGRAPPGVEPAA